jgi:hypothetical protein
VAALQEEKKQVEAGSKKWEQEMATLKAVAEERRKKGLGD